MCRTNASLLARRWPKTLRARAVAALAASVSLVLPGVAFHGSALAHAAHVHGQASLDAAVEGPALSILLASPLDNILGFERAPRNDQERAVVARAREQLQRADSLFVTPPAAKCRHVSTALDFGKLDGKADDDSHADLRADYVFHCDNSAALRSLETGLFVRFPGLRRLAVRVSAPGGQKGATLTKSAPRIAW